MTWATVMLPDLTADHFLRRSLRTFRSIHLDQALSLKRDPRASCALTTSFDLLNHSLACPSFVNSSVEVTTT